MFKPCVVIPVYDHEHAIGGVVQGVLAQQLPCIVVDDGSGRECAEVLDALAGAAPGKMILIRHPVNRGKGSAVLTGARYAAQAGYSHLLQIDADGQHRVADIARFLEQAAAHPKALIVGCPEYDSTAPALRLWARHLTHLWVSINTLSHQIKDSMCGFRVYPVPPLIELDRRQKLGARMNFDV
jgi:glycosyltransferase involved in cell wall biosynthesis